MKQNLSSIIIILFIFVMTACKSPGPKILVDVDQIKYTMQGGIGASWHAISKELPLDNNLYEYPVREDNPRGSAYGGNPPVADTAAWKQIMQHADWLGLNWLRVELSQRMYEPQKGMFEWENEEMHALYLILDWCEAAGADVFLQQMWGNVDWNAVNGVHPLLSAPESLDDFAFGIGELLSFLVVEKGYSCIKYLSIVNEPPGGTWGYWWSYGEETGSVTPAWKRVKEELVHRNLKVKLSAPDWTDLPPFNPNDIDFDQYIDAYDIHSYQGIGEEGEMILRAWSDWAHAKDKPFFLTEIGNMPLGWGGDDPGPASFEAALANTEDILRGLNSGVDAFNRWSFTNRGDLDGQWQLLRTWDRQNKKYLSEILPEPEAYYGYAILTRFISKYADVLECSYDNSVEDLLVSALRNKEDALNIILLNKSDQEIEIEIELQNHADKSLFLYQVSKQIINSQKEPLNPIPLGRSDGSLKLKLPPFSISNVSEIELHRNEKGIM